MYWSLFNLSLLSVYVYIGKLEGTGGGDGGGDGTEEGGSGDDPPTLTSIHSSSGGGEPSNVPSSPPGLCNMQAAASGS